MPQPSKQALLLTADTQAGRSCETALSQLGMAVDWRRDGSDALSHLQQAEPPGLIVLDIQLPGVSGLEIAQHIRRDAQLAAVPVVILTADVICTHLTGVQVAAELLKPILPDDVIAVVQSLQIG